ncbi:MAG: hypothetical protein E7517_06005 [Ruminococcaceae bacterium]|nr:hypothetical protein [Oscillospiraceae bacterium]
MKKTISIILAIAMLLCLFTACGTQKVEVDSTDITAADSLVNSFKTISDAVNCKQATYNQWASVDKWFFYVFDIGASTYRVRAAFDGEIPDDFFENDFTTDEGKAAINKLAGSLAIEKAENLTANMPKQEDVDKFVGKKGQAMLDAGWRTAGIDFENKVVFMRYGAYGCDVAVEEAMKETEDYDEEALFKGATIKSVTNIDIEDAAYMEE